MNSTGVVIFIVVRKLSRVIHYARVSNAPCKYLPVKRKQVIVYVVAVKFVCLEISAHNLIKIPESLHLDILASLKNGVHYFSDKYIL